MNSVDLLRPVVDVVFKRIFGQDKSICLAFICAVLGWEPLFKTFRLSLLIKI